MKLGDFTKGPTVAVNDLTADQAFWGGDDGDQLFIRLFGLPDPDPATRLVMRLADNYASGIGADVLVETVDGEFVPVPCDMSPPPSPAAHPEPAASSARAHALEGAAPPARPAPAAPGARPGAAPAAPPPPPPQPQRRGRR
jgi:hypothetical protein